MNGIYLAIVVFLFVLAIFDLVVGVSNDAVNFLGSAVGARVTSFRKVMIIAAAGILFGALASNGMMEIARHGIFRPEHYYFPELMALFLAVMVSDVVLLDIFNSLGLPTSTTVSMVFELLGGAFALAILKIAADQSGLLTFADLLNTEKALSVIMGIFLSVAIAFFFGAVVQWIVRLLLTFDYPRRLRRSAGLFGGIAVTAIVYFMLIKGLKDAAFMTLETRAWVAAHTWHIVGICFAVSAVAMQIMYRFKVNILRIIVLLGTFALAMAFAGNDLVNFVGVPLAGWASYVDWTTNGAGSSEYLMTALNEPARTPFFFLAAAGLIMIVSLVTSKKARNVIKTSVNLSRQDEGDEMFGSSALARSIVRTSASIAGYVTDHTPAKVKSWVARRFDSEQAVIADGAAFDLVRASVNLLLASLLIALGTSLKLPLSTTYVTFMVAMGTSLADKAWGRESAVFRITGVLSVIGGWFLTAGAAFTLCFFMTLAMHYGGIVAMSIIMVLTIVLLVRSNVRYNRRSRRQDETDMFAHIMAEQDSNEAWTLMRRFASDSTAEVMDGFCDIYAFTTDGVMRNDLRALRKASKMLDEERDRLKRLRRREMLALRRIDHNTALEKNTWLHTSSNACTDIHYALKRLCEAVSEHTSNAFAPMPSYALCEYTVISAEVKSLLLEMRCMTSHANYADMDEVLASAEALRERISAARKAQMFRVQDKSHDLRAAILYLNVLQESQEVADALRRLLKAMYKLCN